MTSQILKSVDFTKAEKFWYLEKEKSFFIEIKEFINYTSRATFWQKNSFVAEAIFNIRFVVKLPPQKWCKIGHMPAK